MCFKSVLILVPLSMMVGNLRLIYVMQIAYNLMIKCVCDDFK